MGRARGCAHLPAARVSGTRNEARPAAVGIYPLNTDRPSPWQPPSRRSHPARQPHLAFLDELSQALTHPVLSVSQEQMLSSLYPSGGETEAGSGDWTQPGSPDSGPGPPVLPDGGRPAPRPGFWEPTGKRPPHFGKRPLAVGSAPERAVWDLWGLTLLLTSGETEALEISVGAGKQAGRHLGLCACGIGAAVPQARVLDGVATGKSLDFPVSASSSLKWV